MVTLADISGFLDSPVVRNALDVLDDGASLQLDVDGASFMVEKTSGQIEAGEGVPGRPFLIIEAGARTLHSLRAAEDAADFADRFARAFTAEDIGVRLMAPPGTAVTYGVISMLKRMGIRPNLIGGD